MKVLKVTAFSYLWLLYTIAESAFNLTELSEEVAELIKNNSNYVLPVNNNHYFKYQASNEVINFGTYDFIIVGAGAAGGVVANRLTEKPSTVLLLESGVEDPQAASIVGLLAYFQNSNWNWGYNTTSQSNACFDKSKNQCLYTRGKALGGSTEINGAFYVRGNAKDYDHWAELGNDGWSYEDVLPYFKKSEYANFTGDIDSFYHGFDGLQSVEFAPDIPDLSSALSDGLKEIGLLEVDYNGRSQLGYGKTQTYLAYNRRAGTKYSFLRPIRDRPNLFVSLNSLVTKVIIKENVAVAVQFIKDGQYYLAHASKEIILSAGAINTPQILMLSGIGPSTELNKHGIAVIADLPVGQNLIDHPAVFGAVNYPTYEVYYNNTIQEAIKLWSQKEGPIVAMTTHLAFIDLNNDTNPDAELMFFTSGTFNSGRFIVNSVNIAVQNNLPSSVGEVTLASGDPRDFPLINPNYFANKTDLETLYQGVQVALKLNNTSSIQSISPGCEVSGPDECNESYENLSRGWWYCVFQYRAQTDYHPVGTTRMGTGPHDSVVDNNLKVHGIDRLRIVDAGVMPTIISGHTNAPTVMIAEKISDIIKQEHF